MNILVTGGNGFIGRNIVEYFGPRYTLAAPSRTELDLTDDAAVRRFLGSNRFDIIIHCATKPGHRNALDPHNLVYNNSRMFFNLLRNKGYFGKMILMSSGLVYDIRHYIPKMREDYFDRHVPADEAGFSKYIAAKYAEEVDNIIELRLFGVFGKYEDYAIRFISNIICKAIFNMPLTIKQNRRFDYIFIDDMMPVLEHFITHDSTHKTYNVTPDSTVELLSLAEKVIRLSGKDLPILVAQDGMGTEYSGDNARLREEMPTLSFTPIDEAIEKLYTWYEGQGSAIRKEYLLVDK